ncbi:hypothetical protein Hanom_Chr05g00416931 [Helianthus anomalus]
MEYCRMHASESRLGTTSRSRNYLASHKEYSGYFSKLWHGWNRRTIWSRVLSGRSKSRSLSLFASAVQ